MKNNKKIGILAFSSKVNGGTYQYTQSMIDALRHDATNKYIIFCDIKESRFDNYGLEVRKINKPTDKFFKKIYHLLILKIKVQIPLLMSVNEKKIFGDIELFVSPAISIYTLCFTKKPLIFTLHDMQERYYPDFFTIKEKIARFIFINILSKKKCKIICESKYIKNDIMKFTKTESDKIFIIQAPPPKEFINFDFTNKKELVSIRKKYNIPQKYILYPANFWFHKNHIRLIEAFKLITKEIDDVHLILTGSQKNNYSNIIKKINDLNLSDKVTHLGYIDYKDLPFVYKLSKMIVMPSLFESVSIPIYEAFSLKVPVCCSNIDGLVEQIGDAALTFNPFNIEEIAQKILVYLRNEDIARENALRGFAKVTNFNHNEYKKKLLAIIDN